jgi:DNA polymerase III subunit delta'
MAPRAIIYDAPAADERDGATAPRDVARLIGQTVATGRFVETWASGRFHHAWLLCGQEGVGKASFAWLAARFVLDGGRLDRPDPLVPQKESQANRLITASSHPDLVLVRRKWDEARKKHKGEIAVDDIRDLKDHFQLAAGLGGYRVAIIDCADDLNGNSANALLKLLEEPPPKCLFLLVCHRPSRLLPTIRSRCRKLDFTDLDEASIEAILADQPLAEGLPRSALAEAARLSLGSVSRAMRYLSPAAVDVRTKSDAALRDLPRIDPSRWMSLAREFQKKDLDGFGIFLEAAEGFAVQCAKQATNSHQAMQLAEASGEIGMLARQADIYNLDLGATSLAILQKLQMALR